MKNHELWQKIEAFTFEKVFIDRLSHENSWEHDFSLEAILEYKKFVYLAIVANPVTPSITVDKVWHLHLTYTQHYWGEMCGKILGQPLHHIPTDNSMEDEAKFSEQYKATYKAYEREFGAPSPNFWGNPFRDIEEKSKEFDFKKFWLLQAIFAFISVPFTKSSQSFLGAFALAMLFLNFFYLLIFLMFPEKNNQNRKKKSDGGCGTSCGGSGGGGCGGGD